MARRILADNPALKLLVDYLEGFGTSRLRASPELQHVMVTHIYDLLAGARPAPDALKSPLVAACALPGCAPRPRSCVRWDAIRFIGKDGRAHLGVTPRYIHMLFEADGTTFTRIVVGQRLARAHRMLLDPRTTEGTIAQSPLRPASDLSHFNRTFRSHYGETPSDARAKGRAMVRLGSISAAMAARALAGPAVRIDWVGPLLDDEARRLELRPSGAGRAQSWT